jgi:hypothetical protein
MLPEGLPPGEMAAREDLRPFLRVWTSDVAYGWLISCQQFGMSRTLKPTRIEPLWYPALQLRIDLQGEQSWEGHVNRKPRPAGRVVTLEAELPASHREAIAEGRASGAKR